MNRSEKVVRVNHFVGLFERLVSFMGFENALYALADDPDSCDEYFGAFTDFTLDYMSRTIDAYRPDEITYYDDVAAQRNMLMSPNTFRELILPHMKRIIAYINSRGILCSYHNCGYCEEIVDDFVGAGVRIWHAAQCICNLDHYQEKYGNALIIQGGWDSVGKTGQIDVTMEEVIQEADRCWETYGKYGTFMLFPVIMNERGNGVFVGDKRLDALADYWHKIARYDS